MNRRDEHSKSHSQPASGDAHAAGRTHTDEAHATGHTGLATPADLAALAADAKPPVGARHVSYDLCEPLTPDACAVFSSAKVKAFFGSRFDADKLTHAASNALPRFERQRRFEQCVELNKRAMAPYATEIADALGVAMARWDEFAADCPDEAAALSKVRERWTAEHHGRAATQHATAHGAPAVAEGRAPTQK